MISGDCQTTPNNFAFGLGETPANFFGVILLHTSHISDIIHHTAYTTDDMWTLRHNPKRICLRARGNSRHFCLCDFAPYIAHRSASIIHHTSYTTQQTSRTVPQTSFVIHVPKRVHYRLFPSISVRKGII